MSTFSEGQVILVNGVKFEITKFVESEFSEINGTLEGDAPFLAGKRTLFISYLYPLNLEHTEFKYEYNAK